MNASLNGLLLSVAMGAMPVLSMLMTLGTMGMPITEMTTSQMIPWLLWWGFTVAMCAHLVHHSRVVQNISAYGLQLDGEAFIDACYLALFSLVIAIPLGIVVTLATYHFLIGIKDGIPLLQLFYYPIVGAVSFLAFYNAIPLDRVCRAVQMPVGG